MRQIPSEKHNIAWFKLAECVARREQERALGVYRLLSHSLGDRALAQQLAGDLSLAFEDPKTAIEKYEQAARLYQQGGRTYESIAVHKHILTIDPSHQHSKEQLAQLLDRSKKSK